jgi:hypothetical protein
MSNVSAIWSVVREPWRISLLAGGGAGVGFAVGRGVGLGVGRGVGRAVGRAVGLGDLVAVARGVAVGIAEALGARPDGDGLETGEPVTVGTWVGRNALGDGTGEMEPGAAGPQLTTTNAAARINLVMDC